MDFFAGVVDFFVNVLGDVLITWMQRLAALDRKRYIVVYILLLLAIAAGAAAAWVRGVYPLAIALTILLPLALLLFVLGLRKPHDRRDTARQRSQAPPQINRSVFRAATRYLQTRGAAAHRI